jgi:hypothetical protein
MNRNQAKALLPIIQAYAEGKAIESRCIKGDTSLWYDDEDPSFDNDFEYRIKPETKYRPFKNAEECWQEMSKHQPFGWIISPNGEVNSLIIFNEGIAIGDRNNGVIGFVAATDLFKIKFADGTPFGVKVE